MIPEPKEKLLELLELGLPDIADIIPHILKDYTDPVQAADTTGSFVGAMPANKKELYVCVHGGYYIKAASINELLGVRTLMHYILKTWSR